MRDNSGKNTASWQSGQVPCEYFRSCSCFSGMNYQDPPRNYYMNGYQYQNYFAQPQYSYPVQYQETGQGQCQFCQIEITNKQNTKQNFNDQANEPQPIKKNVSTQCNLIQTIDCSQRQQSKYQLQDQELPYFESDKNPSLEVFPKFSNNKCANLFQNNEPQESMEKIKKRNQFNDIMHILKVRRYWNNPSFQSPNVFKKRKLKRGISYNDTYEQEINDLSRTKSVAIKDEGDGYASLVDKVATQ